LRRPARRWNRAARAGHDGTQPDEKHGVRDEGTTITGDEHVNAPCASQSAWNRAGKSRYTKETLLRDTATYGTKKKMTLSTPTRREFQTHRRSRDTGFSIIEALVVVAIVATILAITLPMLTRTRWSSREVGSVSNARQIAIVVRGYCDENKGLTPVIFRPIEMYYSRGDESEEVAVNGRLVRGAWFFNASSFHYALNPAIEAEVLLAPGSLNYPKENVGGVTTSDRSDYILTSTFYADPSFWNRWTQNGPQQWHAQRWDSILFPSDKGVVWQHSVYGQPGFPYRHSGPTFAGVRSAVMWGDLSGGNEEFAKLNPGEPNFFHHGAFSPHTYFDDGFPVDETLHGIHGRDRGTYEPAKPGKGSLDSRK
jgi:type II secretory pathway pseudopilin PulG